MDNLFKKKKKLIINNIGFDEYRKAKDGTAIEIRVNESVENIMIHKELDKLRVKTITTIFGFENNKTQIFSFVLRSNVEISLKEKLKTKGKINLPIISEEMKSQAGNIALTENKAFIKQFFSKTHMPISSDEF